MNAKEGRLAALPIRAHPLVFGVVLFLASELMFFAGLFASYFGLRGVNGVWPPANVHLDRVESSIATLILAFSSVTMLMFSRAYARQYDRIARRWLLVTIACAIVFLLIALHGWSKNQFTISSHAYGTLFYTMTGFHALHVLVGVLLMTALAIGLRRPAFKNADRSGAEAISYYWHFVFIVWVGLWGTIYWIQ